MQVRNEERVLLIDVSDRRLAINSRAVVELLLLPHLSRPPRTPSALAGFMNLSGVPVPVLRLRTLLSFDASDDGLYTPVVVVGDKSRPLGLIVDRINRLVAVEVDARAELEPDSTFNRCADHAIRIGEEIIAVLSLDRLLLDAEQSRIREFARIEAERLAALEATTS
ncbi:MAG: hypothetical protein GC162_01930 [Planctomycetes bacterium]|nr:hypothetical protein [Planctomycetota bacterium]